MSHNNDSYEYLTHKIFLCNEMSHNYDSLIILMLMSHCELQKIRDQNRT